MRQGGAAAKAAARGGGVDGGGQAAGERRGAARRAGRAAVVKHRSGAGAKRRAEKVVLLDSGRRDGKGWAGDDQTTRHCSVGLCGSARKQMQQRSMQCLIRSARAAGRTAICWHDQKQAVAGMSSCWSVKLRLFRQVGMQCRSPAMANQPLPSTIQHIIQRPIPRPSAAGGGKVHGTSSPQLHLVPAYPPTVQ